MLFQGIRRWPVTCSSIVVVVTSVQLVVGRIALVFILLVYSFSIINSISTQWATNIGKKTSQKYKSLNKIKLTQFMMSFDFIQLTCINYSGLFTNILWALLRLDFPGKILFTMNHTELNLSISQTSCNYFLQLSQDHSIEISYRSSHQRCSV